MKTCRSGTINVPKCGLFLFILTSFHPGWWRQPFSTTALSSVSSSAQDRPHPTRITFLSVCMRLSYLPVWTNIVSKRLHLLWDIIANHSLPELHTEWIVLIPWKADSETTGRSWLCCFSWLEFFGGSVVLRRCPWHCVLSERVGEPPVDDEDGGEPCQHR